MPVAHLNSVDLNYLKIESQRVSDRLDIGFVDGANPPLIMVHGLATNLAFWYPLTPALNLLSSVVLYDLRGHGRSSMPLTGYTPSEQAEDLRELLDYLGIKTAHFLAHSFGGSVALNFDYAYPDRVESLILADTRLRALQPRQCLSDSPRGVRIGQTLAKIGIWLDEDDPEAGYHILEAIARHYLKTDPEDLSRRRERILARLAPKGSKRTSARWLKLLETTTARSDFLYGDRLSIEQLEKIKKPTLAIYGENSPTLPTVYALKDIWHHARYEFVPNAGHFFPISQPQRLVASVQSFLTSHVLSVRC